MGRKADKWDREGERERQRREAGGEAENKGCHGG